MTKISTRSRVLVGMVGIGVLLAACGGDDGESDGATATTASPGPAITGDTAATTLPGSSVGPPLAETTPPPTTAPAETTTPTTPASTAPPTTALPPAAAPPAEAQLQTASVALQKFVELPLLTAVVQHPDGALWFTSQTGEIWKMIEGGQPELVLDLRGEVAPWAEGSERGMLGIGFNPADGRLFLYFNDPDSDSHVVSYALDANGKPDPATRWEVLFVDQPGIGHKGGGIIFDELGQMYLALGDGGGSRGRDAQDYTKLLGGIIRIIPRTDGPGYDIPGDNPFLGDTTIAPELFAKGLRNPWGFCRDQATGDMWITDVGEDTIEEINHIPAGSMGMNFGWWQMEGSNQRDPSAIPGNQLPVWEYRHDEFGPAAIGGCVYRGTKIPALQGAYLMSDMSGPMFALGEGFVPVRLALPEQGRIVTAVKMGIDGEPIILTLQNGAYRLVPV
ncbi:MAG: PQQ-dependent sugar dehydrogenase [Ilumatobacteraceae bacterium]